MINTEKLLKTLEKCNINSKDNLNPESVVNSYSLSLKKCSIYDSLFNANTLDEILNAAQLQLNNPIFIVDTSYCVLCRSSSAYAVTSCIEEHNNKCYIILDTVSLMKKYKCIDNIYNSNKAFFHYDTENLIFCSIKVNNVTTGYISVLEKDKKFNECDLELVNTLSKVISTFTEKENIFISNSGLCDEYYLIDLLSNKISSENICHIMERLKESSFTPKDNFIIISIPYIQKYKDYRFNYGLKMLMKSCKNIFKNCLSTYYENSVIILVSSHDTDIINTNMKMSFKEFLRLNKLKCGISFIFDDLIYIHDYMLQSIYSVNLCKNNNKNNIISYFEDYVDYYLFSMLDSNLKYEKINLNSLVHPLLKKLILYDKNNNSELFYTLKIYIQNHRSAAKTAQALNINKSTFFYRFHKIESILNEDLNSIIYKLESSIRLLSYIS